MAILALPATWLLYSRAPSTSTSIEATQTPEGKVLVPIKPICQRLGLDAKSQRQKLKGKLWAGGVMIASPDNKGSEQEMFALPLDSLPMWLATIEPSRVKEEIR